MRGREEEGGESYITCAGAATSSATFCAAVSSLGASAAATSSSGSLTDRSIDLPGNEFCAQQPPTDDVEDDAAALLSQLKGRGSGVRDTPRQKHREQGGDLPSRQQAAGTRVRGARPIRRAQTQAWCSSHLSR